MAVVQYFMGILWRLLTLFGYKAEGRPWKSAGQNSVLWHWHSPFLLGPCLFTFNTDKQWNFPTSIFGRIPQKAPELSPSTVPSAQLLPKGMTGQFFPTTCTNTQMLYFRDLRWFFLLYLLFRNAQWSERQRGSPKRWQHWSRSWRGMLQSLLKRLCVVGRVFTLYEQRC